MNKWTTPAKPICRQSRDAAAQRQTQLTKPPGSLARLEQLALDFAGWQGTPLPTVNKPVIRVFAADHGVAEEGVSAFPQAVTVEMIRNFCRGGAAITVLARQTRADFAVVNLGTAQSLEPLPGLDNIQIRNGTANICREPAMAGSDLERALQAGADSVPGDTDLFIGGEMGIGNTTVAAALTAALLSLPAASLVGRGTGVDDRGLRRKTAVVERALQLHRPHCTTALESLRRLGGLEIAALAGAYISCAQRGIPAVVDGFITTAAALAATHVNPGVRPWLLFSHQSAESGHQLLLEALQGEPLLDLQMRLGEGSGAALVLSLIQSALGLHRDMATFAEAGVSQGEVP